MRNRNGTVYSAPRLVRDTACFGGKYLYFSSNSTNYGPAEDHNTTNSYARQTGRVIVMYPMIVSAILWDVRIADDYICRFVTAIDGSSVLYNVNTSVTVAAPGTVTITPTDGDFLLLPGVNFLQLAVHDGATVQWWDRNAATQDYTAWFADGICYTTTASYSQQIPIRFTARIANFANMTEYSK